MSIGSEITRISNAKTAIAESIANKGVTVPSGTKIDGMAALIDSIQTGGAPSLQSKSVTYTSNGTNTITPDAGYDGLSSVDVTVDVSGGGGATETSYYVYIVNEDFYSITVEIGDENISISSGGEYTTSRKYTPSEIISTLTITSQATSGMNSMALRIWNDMYVINVA